MIRSSGPTTTKPSGAFSISLSSFCLASGITTGWSASTGDNRIRNSVAPSWRNIEPDAVISRWLSIWRIRISSARPIARTPASMDWIASWLWASKAS